MFLSGVGLSNIYLFWQWPNYIFLQFREGKMFYLKLTAWAIYFFRKLRKHRKSNILSYHWLVCWVEGRSIKTHDKFPSFVITLCNQNILIFIRIYLKCHLRALVSVQKSKDLDILLIILSFSLSPLLQGESGPTEHQQVSYNPLKKRSHGSTKLS